MAALERDDGFASPRDAGEEGRQRGVLLAQRVKEVGDIVEQSAEGRRIAARLGILPGAAAVQKRYGEAGLAQPATRSYIPTGVALDAMHEHHPAARRAGGGVIAEMAAITVAGGVGPQRESRTGRRFDQTRSLLFSSLKQRFLTDGHARN